MMQMRNDNSDYNRSSSSSFVVYKRNFENSGSNSLLTRYFFQVIPIEKKPNTETLLALSEAENPEKLENYSSIDVFFNDLKG